MKRTLLFIGFLLTSVLAYSADNPYPLITNVDSRGGQLLDGMWKTTLDPLEVGYYNYRRMPDENGFFLDKPQKNQELIEYDFETSNQLYVPRDWNTQNPELLYYEGTVWYRRLFDYNLPKGERLFLHFAAVNYEAIVFLNGQQLGIHKGGYTPFNFEITDMVKQGKNSLVVKVDNRRDRSAVPTNNFDWWNYGGITRSVTLIQTPANFIRDYLFQLKKGTSNTIAGWVQMSNETKNEKITINVPELKKSLTLTTDGNGYAAFEFVATPVLWSPERPKLYAVEFSTANNKVSDMIGLRTIETQGNKIMLNGKQIFCRGISIHEEAPYRSGRASGKEDARTLLGWAKDMGCNFARLAHYTHNEHMVREAERMGILLWAEVPVYWTIDWTNPDVLANAKNQLGEMITRDKNRCNVIIWSVANETPLGDDRLSFLKQMIEHARRLDNTRLISAAMEKEEIRPGLMTVHDPLGEYLDVFAFNQYIGWYDGFPEKCDKVNWELPKEKPILISEFGGGALYGRHGDKSERWTEEFQEDMYIKSVNMLKRIDGLSGTTPWILMDFRSPRRPLTGIQDGFNRKGLVSNFGDKKKAFYVMQNWYKELTEQYK